MRKFLYINGQDISRLILGIGSDKTIDVLDEIDSSPERFLKHLQVFLNENKLALKDFDQTFVIVGPGSATALRAILSIINSIKFVYDLRIYAIKKESDEQDSYTFQNCMEGKVDEIEHKKYFFPIYENKPKITLSTKDELGR